MKTNNVQITFDLLGEIVKFNKINIVILNRICEKEDYQPRLLQIMEENIIDSNVFLRSLVIGFEKFQILRKNQVFNNFKFNLNHILEQCIPKKSSA